MTDADDPPYPGRSRSSRGRRSGGRRGRAAGEGLAAAWSGAHGSDATGSGAHGSGAAGSGGTSSAARSGGAGGDAGGRTKDPEQQAREICLRLLETRPRTRAELAAALARRDIPDEVSEQILGRYAEIGLVDDEAFARAWVTTRHAGKGLARRALAGELRRRGVDDDLVEDAVAELDPEDERATARALVERRMRTTAGLPAPVRVRRLVAVLARKGYPAGTAWEIVRDALAAEGEADPDELADLDDLVMAGDDDSF